jgi:hypothetical protein
MSGAQLAREAVLTPPAVYAALERLGEIGIVERLGLRSRGQFLWNEKYPLASALRSLFAAERGRVERLVEGLKQAASSISPPPRSVWWYGPSARGDDRLGDPLHMAIVANAREIGDALDQFRDAVASLDLEQRHDVAVEVRGLTLEQRDDVTSRVLPKTLEQRDEVTIEVRGLTQADLLTLTNPERVELEQAQLILGLPPDHFFGPKTGSPLVARVSPKSQADSDRRLLEIAAAVARKLDRNLIEEARDRVRRRLQQGPRQASPAERRSLHEWETILHMSLPRLRRFLVDRGPRATRLRQTFPFLEVPSVTTRRALPDRDNE